MARHHSKYRNQRRRAIDQPKGGCAHSRHQVTLIEGITLFADLHDQAIDGSEVTCKQVRLVSAATALLSMALVSSSAPNDAPAESVGAAVDNAPIIYP